MKKEKLVLPLIIISSIIMAYILYVNAVINSDDAGTYVYLYNYFELGNFNLSTKQLLNPWFISSAIAYLMNIGGSGATISIAYLAAWYGLAVFFTLLIINDSVRNKWLLTLALFIMIPYANTNRYHMFSTLVCLMLLWGILYYQKSKKKWGIIIGTAMTIYALAFSDDRMIVVLFIGVTVLFYVAILLLQDRDKHKFLYVIAIFVTAVAMIIKYADIIGGYGITSEWGGYGGSAYLTWTSIATLFEKGIPSVFSSLFNQWNIRMSGGMIQFMSFYWIVRIVIAILAIIALISRWRQIVKNGINSLELIDGISVVCVTSVLFVNMCNGMAWYYELDNVPMNRYASVCWFLLVVVLVRWIDERYVNIAVYQNITSNIVLTIVFIALSVGYVNPICKIMDSITNSYCFEEINLLREQGDNYKNGIASYWKGKIISAASNSEYFVDTGWITDGKLVDNPSAEYLDGTNYYNFIISDSNNEMTVSRENIDEVRDDYTKINGFGDSSIYLYDYDIRFDEQLVMECWPESGDYELVDDLVYHLDFPVGTNRIQMTVGNSGNFELSIDDNPDVAGYTVQVIDDTTIYVDLVCTQNTKVDFNVKRIADEYTTIHKICLKRVRASVVIDEEVTDFGQSVYLKEGSYVITFAGENLSKMQVDWIGNDVNVEQLTDGRIKRRYQIDVSSDQTVYFNISGSNSMVIDKISYENEVLFDDENEEE